MGLQVSNDDEGVSVADLRTVGGRRRQQRSDRRSSSVTVGSTQSIRRCLPTADVVLASTPLSVRGAPTGRPWFRRRLLTVRQRFAAGGGQTVRQWRLDLDAGSGLRLRLQEPPGHGRWRQRQARPHHALRKVTRSALHSRRFAYHSAPPASSVFTADTSRASVSDEKQR